MRITQILHKKFLHALLQLFQLGHVCQTWQQDLWLVEFLAHKIFCEEQALRRVICS